MSGDCRLCKRQNVILDNRGYCVDENACFDAWYARNPNAGRPRRTRKPRQA